MEDMLAIEKEAIEATYFGVMDVYEEKEYTENNRIRHKKEKVMGGIKCALSKKQLTNTIQNSQNGEINYIFEIFTSPEHDIKAGSHIHVKQDGMDYQLENTGESHKYKTHQEIICQRKDKA